MSPRVADQSTCNGYLDANQTMCVRCFRDAFRANRRFSTTGVRHIRTAPATMAARLADPDWMAHKRAEVGFYEGPPR